MLMPNFPLTIRVLSDSVVLVVITDFNSGMTATSLFQSDSSLLSILVSALIPKELHNRNTYTLASLFKTFLK